MPEAKLSDLISKFHGEQHGSVPSSVEVQILPSMVVALSSEVFTATEKQLTDTEDGRKIVQSARRELRAMTRRQIETQIALALGKRVLRSYYDLDVRAAQQIEIYIVEA